MVSTTLRNTPYSWLMHLEPHSWLFASTNQLLVVELEVENIWNQANHYNLTIVRQVITTFLQKTLKRFGSSVYCLLFHFRIITRFWELELSTYPSPKPTLTFTSHLGQNFGLGRGGWAVSSMGTDFFFMFWQLMAASKKQVEELQRAHDQKIKEQKIIEEKRKLMESQQKQVL